MTDLVAVILLAAGASRRMRGRDKLLEDAGGQPLLRRVAETAWTSTASEIVAVLGARSDARMSALDGLPIRMTINHEWQSGMASSIARGITSVEKTADAALILLGDMPDVKPALLDRMIAHFDPANGIDIIRPVAASGPVGNPVLFGKRHFPALKNLSGDTGAKSVIADNPDAVLDLPTADDGVLIDLDTPEAWSKWKADR